MAGTEMNDLETFTVTETNVACDGGELGHPKVYLKIDPKTGETVCPYCSRRYVLAEGAKTAAH
jgi:uncharacterized Zn-finger protein